MDTAKLFARREKDRAYQAARRAAQGATPRERSKARTKPWRVLGVSRAHFYRLSAAGLLEERLMAMSGGETVSSAAVTLPVAETKTSALGAFTAAETSSSDDFTTAALTTKPSQDADLWSRLIANAPAARAELAEEPWPSYR